VRDPVATDTVRDGPLGSAVISVAGARVQAIARAATTTEAANVRGHGARRTAVPGVQRRIQTPWIEETPRRMTWPDSGALRRATAWTIGTMKGSPSSALRPATATRTEATIVRRMRPISTIVALGSGV